MARQNTIEYTEFNKVTRLQLYHTVIPTHTYDITYGPDDQRRKTSNQIVFGDEKTTIFVNGGLYEERCNGEMLHYIATPAGLSAVVVTHKIDPSKKDIYYLYNDHLGSLIAATQRGSTVLEEFSYDPWGRRRNPNDWNDYDVAESTLFTRGFTGHEHIGSYSLINMNGRVYDPRLGRFLSPDPYVQAPDFSQSYNRYSYVWNNPLKYTDPDGEFVHLIIGAIIGGYTGYKIGKANGATGWSMFGYIAGGAAIGTLAGHVGASVFAYGMTAGSTAGMSSISTAFNAGMISGIASGAISGGGYTALAGGSVLDILGGITHGAVIGGFSGAAGAAAFQGMNNLLNKTIQIGSKGTMQPYKLLHNNTLSYMTGSTASQMTANLARGKNPFKGVDYGLNLGLLYPLSMDVMRYSNQYNMHVARKHLKNNEEIVSIHRSTSLLSNGDLSLDQTIRVQEYYTDFKMEMGNLDFTGMPRSIPTSYHFQHTMVSGYHWQIFSIIQSISLKRK